MVLCQNIFLFYREENMASDLKNLKPENLWKHFAEFLKIPHCSENEKEMGEYVMNFAKSLNLEADRDEVGNIVVRKKASPGKEEVTTVILQGHLDMVCEKNSDINFDFSKDSIQPVIDGDWVRAEGTTLGADNGIGLAAGMAIMEDNTLIHGPLEFLFTVEEETGLKGATSIKPDFLKGKILLNLDSEDEGEFTIGCAGGADTKIFLPLTRKTSSEGVEYMIKLSGFKGGHSGVDINLGRANAIKAMARILWQVSKATPFQLVNIKGGNLRNAIPRESWAFVLLDESKVDAFSDAVHKAFENIRIEYKVIDPNAAISIEKSEEDGQAPLDTKSQQALINFLFTIPHGIIAMHSEMIGLVETSTNLAVIRTLEDKAEIICSTRSSTDSALEATRNVISAQGETAGADVIQEDGYPGWKPDLDSPLLQTMKALYEDTFNEKPHIAAIHAGLECGIIGEKFEGMDMISFGPTIKFPHSPDEKVEIPTVEKFWFFLLKVLEGVA